MLKRLFLEHPRSLKETYLEHLGHASSFGLSLVLAGAACLVHAVVPAVFETTGSREVHRLREKMMARRSTTHPASKIAD